MVRVKSISPISSIKTMILRASLGPYPSSIPNEYPSQISTSIILEKAGQPTTLMAQTQSIVRILPSENGKL